MKEATIVAIFTGKDMPAVYEATRILDKADVSYERLLRPQSTVKVPLTGHYLRDEMHGTLLWQRTIFVKLRT